VHPPYALPATACEQVALARGQAAQAAGAAPLAFDGPRPDVARHAIGLGAGWMVSGSPLIAAGWDGWPVITRGDVLDWAAQARAGRRPWRDVLIASYAWGTGAVSYGPVRIARVLAAGNDIVEHAVTSAVRTLDEHGAVAAYWAMNNRPPAGLRLPFLGPAFFTKLLYFAGYRRGAGGRQPLILDSVVRRRLPVEAGVRRESGWVSEEWLAYLGWAADQAQRRGIEPDEVEMALFHDRWS